MFFINFEIPPISASPDMDFIIENTNATLIIGARQDKRIFSVSAINIIIDAFPRAAVESFPSKMFMTVITGAKEVITAQRVRIYVITLLLIPFTRLNTEREMQSAEHRL